jgi:hypothetical protein
MTSSGLPGGAASTATGWSTASGLATSTGSSRASAPRAVWHSTVRAVRGRYDSLLFSDYKIVPHGLLFGRSTARVGGFWPAVAQLEGSITQPAAAARSVSPTQPQAVPGGAWGPAVALLQDVEGSDGDGSGHPGSFSQPKHFPPCTSFLCGRKPLGSFSGCFRSGQWFPTQTSCGHSTRSCNRSRHSGCSWPGYPPWDSNPHYTSWPRFSTGMACGSEFHWSRPRPSTRAF